jgi:hypothetical protein
MSAKRATSRRQHQQNFALATRQVIPFLNKLLEKRNDESATHSDNSTSLKARKSAALAGAGVGSYVVGLAWHHQRRAFAPYLD